MYRLIKYEPFESRVLTEGMLIPVDTRDGRYLEGKYSIKDLDTIEIKTISYNELNMLVEGDLILYKSPVNRLFIPFVSDEIWSFMNSVLVIDTANIDRTFANHLGAFAWYLDNYNVNDASIRYSDNMIVLKNDIVDYHYKPKVSEFEFNRLMLKYRMLCT